MRRGSPFRSSRTAPLQGHCLLRGANGRREHGNYSSDVQRATSESSPFVAGLDGLRAIAVLAVLAFHSRFGAASGGFLGVSLFFTLSGYLITQLLIRESALGGGRIDVRAFWMRRFRRLMPGAIVVIVAVALASIFFDRFPSPHLRGDLFSALGYVANWRFMAGSTSYADLFTSVPSPVLHFWSLAIEEQFYVVYPVLIAVLSARRRKWIVPGTLGMLFAASVTANVLGGSHNTVYYGTQTRAAEILAGALLGLWFPLGGLPAGDPGRMRRWLGSPVVNGLVFATALSGFVYLVVTVDTGDSWLYAGGLSAISVLSVILIIGVQSPGPVRWIAERSVLVRIGGLSYGLYLYHWPIFQFSRHIAGKPLTWMQFIGLMAVTLVVTELSYRFIETPIRHGRLGPWLRSWRGAPTRQRMAHRRRMLIVGVVAVALPVFAAVNLSTAKVQLDDITQSLVDADEFTTNLLSNTTVAPSVDSVSPSSTAAVPSTVATQKIDVLAIGDSVMLGAAEELAQYGITVDAQKSRPFKAALPIVNYVKSVGALGNAVVIHLGTNSGTSQETIDSIMAPLAEVPLVVVLTNAVPGKSWEKPNNTLIRALPDRYPNVKVLDWKLLVDPNPKWVYDDGTHLRPIGQQRYAEAILQALGRPAVPVATTTTSSTPTEASVATTTLPG